MPRLCRGKLQRRASAGICTQNADSAGCPRSRRCLFEFNGLRLALSADGDFYDLAPDAYLRVADAEDGAVFPFRERGGEWDGVGVAGGGVGDEPDPAQAAIHLDVDDLEVCAEALPAPVDDYAGRDAFGGDVRLQSGEVGRIVSPRRFGPRRFVLSRLWRATTMRTRKLRRVISR